MNDVKFDFQMSQKVFCGQGKSFIKIHQGVTVVIKKVLQFRHSRNINSI